MDLEVVRAALAREITANVVDPNLNTRFVGARRIITAAGIEALQIQYPNGLSLGDVLLHAASASRTSARRSFAVLVIDALAVAGLIPSTSERPDIDRNICALAESAVPEILDRFKYPWLLSDFRVMGWVT